MSRGQLSVSQSERESILRAVAESSLNIGDSSAGNVCPRCGGGDSKERSLSVSRKTFGVAFLCHRDSCGFRGVLNDVSNSYYSSSGKKPSEDKSKYLSFSPLLENEKNLLSTKYHLTSGEICISGIRWSNTIQRIIIPIRTRNGLSAGFVARSENPKVRPKALNYIVNPELPFGAYYIKDRECKCLWLVEDQLSAIRLSKYENALALMGTHLTDSLLADIKKGGFTHLVICLDADAMATAIKLASRIDSLFKEVRVRSPKKDLKNMTPQELRKFLTGV